MKYVIALFTFLTLLSCKSKIPVSNEPTVPADTLQTYTVTPENVMEASLNLPGANETIKTYCS